MNVFMIVVFYLTLVIFFSLCLFNKRFRELFVKPYPRKLQRLTEEEFYNQFINSGGNIGNEEETNVWKELSEKAWEVRNFEIDLYWKRANYFWLFQVPAFLAYFSFYKILDKKVYFPDEIFIVCCLGIFFSTAWLLINKGSKAWQRHWEVYIDLIEKKRGKPIYMTVSLERTYSVSKINEIVSFAFIIVWLFFLIKVTIQNQYLYKFDYNLLSINPIIALSAFLTCVGIISMLFGYGRGYFKDREVVMMSRSVTYKS